MWPPVLGTGEWQMLRSWVISRLSPLLFLTLWTSHNTNLKTRGCSGLNRTRWGGDYVFPEMLLLTVPDLFSTWHKRILDLSEKAFSPAASDPFCGMLTNFWWPIKVTWWFVTHFSSICGTCFQKWFFLLQFLHDDDAVKTSVIGRQVKRHGSHFK